ncbi:Xaa-Pro aminopeptidase [Photobacterium aphoticum]|nr:Xaa-Pro aminopeptidase [Photobacterium aphoticum]
MTDSELAWLNRYHETVFAAISPALEGDDLAWLEQATAPLSR